MANEWKRGGDDYQRDLDREVSGLGRRIEKIDRLLSGDPIEHEDGLETRLHNNERLTHKLEVVLFGEEGTHREGLWKDLQDLRADITNLTFELKAIRQDKSIKVERRRDTLIFWAAVIGGWLGFAGLLVSNADKIAGGIEHLVSSVFKPDDKELELERLRRQIVELRQQRGSAVNRKIAELEAAAKRLGNE